MRSKKLTPLSPPRMRMGNAPSQQLILSSQDRQEIPTGYEWHRQIDEAGTCFVSSAKKLEFKTQVDVGHKARPTNKSLTMMWVGLYARHSGKRRLLRTQGVGLPRLAARTSKWAIRNPSKKLCDLTGLATWR